MCNRLQLITITDYDYPRSVSSLNVPSLSKEHDLCRSAIVGQPKNWFYCDATQNYACIISHQTSYDITIYDRGPVNATIHFGTPSSLL